MDITPLPMVPAGARWDKVSTYCVNVAKKPFTWDFSINSIKFLLTNSSTKYVLSKLYSCDDPLPHNKPFISHPFPVNCMHSPYLKKRTSKPLKTRQPNIFFVYKTESIAI